MLGCVVLQENDEWLRLTNLPLASLKLRGLGAKRLKRMADAQVHSVLDLLAHLPKGYRDFSQITRISHLKVGQDALIQGRVLSIHSGRTARKRVPIVEGLIDDGTGTLRVLWFNQAYLAKRFSSDRTCALWGKVKRVRLGMTMINPKIQWGQAEGVSDRIHVVYPQLAGMTSELLAQWISQLLEAVACEPGLPPSLIEDWALPGFYAAMRCIHQPKTLMASGQPTGFDGALRRLKVQEFYAFQHQLQEFVAASQQRDHPRVQVVFDHLRLFYRQLPFVPTGDQTRVIREIWSSLNDGDRLVALVQGDVGSGKTLVALAVGLLFYQAGYQSAFMVPTTLLANQHYQSALRFLSELGVRVGLLSRDQNPAMNRQVIAGLKSGDIDFVVGTHKLFQEQVHLPKLGLVMIDEQHRFGVAQRSALLKKAAAPHYLAFSATPIPRSLALTLYGDFQVFQLSEKPASRKPIRTILKRVDNRKEVLAFALKRVACGEAVYWVFPLVDGEASQTQASAVTMHRRLAMAGFAPDRVGLVHGQMDRASMAATMAAFRQGDLDLLVATTVIEVGVDVPHASVMIIEGAHHFGLSQLHQLRGRVGRDQRQAYCFMLVPGDLSADALKRLRLLEATDDGFLIAESDLAFRGAGHLLGKEQSGKPAFRFGDPWQDQGLMSSLKSWLQDRREEVQ